MASLPVRRSGRNQTLMNPTREFEDIYDRMGQLMNFAFGGLTPVALADMPWAPLGDVSETDDAYIVRVELPGVEQGPGGRAAAGRRAGHHRRDPGRFRAEAAAATAARAAPAGSSSGPTCPATSTPKG